MLVILLENLGDVSGASFFFRHQHKEHFQVHNVMQTWSHWTPKNIIHSNFVLSKYVCITRSWKMFSSSPLSRKMLWVDSFLGGQISTVQVSVHQPKKKINLLSSTWTRHNWKRPLQWDDNSNSMSMTTSVVQVTVPFDLSFPSFVMTFWLAQKAQEVLNKKWSNHSSLLSLLFFSLWTVFLSAHSLCFSKNSLISFPLDFSFRTLAVSGKFAQLSECVGWFGLFHPIMLTVSQVTVFNWEQPRASLLMQLDKEPHALFSSFFGCLTSLYLQLIYGSCPIKNVLTCQAKNKLNWSIWSF